MTGREEQLLLPPSSESCSPDPPGHRYRAACQEPLPTSHDDGEEQDEEAALVSGGPLLSAAMRAKMKVGDKWLHKTRRNSEANKTNYGRALRWLVEL